MPSVPSGRRWSQSSFAAIDGDPIGVHGRSEHQTRNGKAHVEPLKMMLGPCRGGAVRLDEIGRRLLVGNGIETCLAAMQATGPPTWGALST